MKAAESTGVPSIDQDAGLQALMLPPCRQIYQCSAITESAVIPVRQQEVDNNFINRLRGRMIDADTLQDQELFGQLMSTYLLPDDFLKLIDGETPLTLVLDPTTAALPWEMGALRINRTVNFFAPNLGLTRQFTTLLSTPPGVPPPVTNEIRVLIIADPASDQLQLRGARQEGFEVARVFADARRAYRDLDPQNPLNVRLTLRIGSAADKTWSNLQLPQGAGNALEGILDEDQDRLLLQDIRKAARCDPLEVLSLLLVNEFDVVHFAGHGVFDQKSDRKGWVFSRDCVLTAREIFRVHQVPRLVFANACRSTEMEESTDALPSRKIEDVSVAEGFFARGIENYIGAGWPVNDSWATYFAVRFYSHVLGVTVTPRSPPQANEPQTVGKASRKPARSCLPGSERATSSVPPTASPHSECGVLTSTTARPLPRSSRRESEAEASALPACSQGTRSWIGNLRELVLPGAMLAQRAWRAAGARIRVRAPAGPSIEALHARGCERGAWHAAGGSGRLRFVDEAGFLVPAALRLAASPG